MQDLLTVETVCLNDGRHLILTDRLHEDETGIAGGVAPKLRAFAPDAEDEGDCAFPDGDEEDDRLIFETIQTHARTLELLIEAGHVTIEQVSQARELALKLT